MEETFNINTLHLHLITLQSTLCLCTPCNGLVLRLERLHLTHKCFYVLLYHFPSFSSRMQIKWKQSDCIFFWILTALTGQGCTWTHHILWWLNGGGAGFCLDRGKWPWCGLFACRPRSNFCMSHWRGKPLTPSFHHWHWNPSQGMSAWPAVIASQSWCHRVATFPRSSSQLLHTLMLLSVLV